MSVPQQTEDRGRDETEETDEDGGEERLSHENVIELCHLRRSSSSGSRGSRASARGHRARARRRDGPRAACAAAGARRVPRVRRRHRVRRACATRWRRPRAERPAPSAAGAPTSRSIRCRAARSTSCVVTRYLQRDLFPRAARARRARAASCCTRRSRRRSARSAPGRRRRITCCEPGELRERFDGFEVLFYEEVTAPEAVARIVARRPRLQAVRRDAEHDLAADVI